MLDHTITEFRFQVQKSGGEWEVPKLERNDKQQNISFLGFEGPFEDTLEEKR